MGQICESIIDFIRNDLVHLRREQRKTNSRIETEKDRRSKSNRTKTIRVLFVVNKKSIGFVIERQGHRERNTNVLPMKFLEKFH